jgi:hypothetical protein
MIESEACVASNLYKLQCLAGEDVLGLIKKYSVVTLNSYILMEQDIDDMLREDKSNAKLNEIKYAIYSLNNCISDLEESDINSQKYYAWLMEQINGLKNERY